MSENLNGLFNESNHQDNTANARSLAGTAQLTNLATSIASDIIKKVDANFADYKGKVAESKTSHSAMDQLIKDAYDLSTADITFLKELDEITLDGMLKSQQSKRSRSKGKVMTMDNYRSMMTGAIAENLIRLATGNVKTPGTTRRFAGSLEYTAEQLLELNDDQEKLRREIRNLQSKKSIMKSKENFSESDERWQQLLVAETQLKELRGEPTKTVVVDETKNKLNELLAAVTDINHMKPADAKRLLEEIKQLTEAEKLPAASDLVDTTNEEV